MCLLGINSYDREKKLEHSSVSRLHFFTWEVVLLLTVFSIFSGVRYNVGVDYKAYLSYYLNLQEHNKYIFDMEFLFELITRFFSYSGLHFSFYFTFIAFIQILVFYKSFQNQRFLYPFFAIIIVLGPYYLVWMNGMRQILAAVIFVYSIKFIVNKKLAKYLLCIFIAFLFHKSAILLIPIYFLPQLDYFKSRLFTVVLLFLSVALGSINIIPSLLEDIAVISSFIGYENISYQMASLVEHDATKSWGPRNLALFITSVLVIIISNRVKDYFSHDKLTVYYNLSIIGFIFSNILMNAHNIFLRPIIYLNTLSIIIIAYSFAYLFFDRTKRLNLFLFVVLFVLVACYMPLSVIADFGKGSNDFSSYKSFFSLYDQMY